ncbi:hypothetical protein J6590_013623 [Homalodisca vitripennis]|nr:hypothetical protein J6590_013623 [Homalodisca vitripennis]
MIPHSSLFLGRRRRICRYRKVKVRYLFYQPSPGFWRTFATWIIPKGVPFFAPGHYPYANQASHSFD